MSRSSSRLACLSLVAALAGAMGIAAEVREPTGEAPLEPAATIWHLGHSGVAVETAGHLLIFDYSDDRPVIGRRPGLGSGVVEAEELAGERAVVFFSHEHHDHFWPDAIGWLQQAPGLRFVVSPEVAQVDRRYAARAGVVDVLAPDTERRVGALRIETLRSTDSGVAFLVEVDGLLIYHAGDHSSWSWGRQAGEVDRFVEEELRPLHGRVIDIAFQVADPRFSDTGWGGVVAFAHRLAPRLLVPIHLRGDYSKMDQLAEEIRASDFSGEFWKVTRRGASRTYAAPAARAD